MSVAPPATEIARSYAEWFDWASTHYGDDQHAHVATQAAIAALQGGADAPSAVAAGQQAANAPDAIGRPLTADKPTQAYAAWYVWARHKVGLDPQRTHLAAAAGRGAQANGAPVSTAQNHALAVAGVGPGMVTTASAGAFPGGFTWRDPALRAIVFGIVCLVVPFFGFYFLILPILGLVYSVRALAQSRFVFGIIGVLLNGIATAFTALLFFHVL
ncbi:MAG: hypothetical protein M3Z84_02740 [Actinomycetota bacterium]|nr:hypothetical protein [Actinomycetota bacterium]